MADEDRIRYRDIIEPDDSIEKLIAQLSELNKSYEVMVNAIKSAASKITAALKQTSGATQAGRQAIDEQAAAASRLERAYKELQFAMSDTGKTVAQLKAQTTDVNKASVEQMRYIKQAATSYDRLKSELKEMVALYKSLSAAGRADSSMGGALLTDIQNLRTQIKAIDDSLKPAIQTMSQMQKAQQALAAATSANNVVLQEYVLKTKQATEAAKLQAQEAINSQGSYNALSARYQLNVNELNKMSQAEKENTAYGQQLVASTKALQVQLQALALAEREAAQSAQLNAQIKNSSIGSYNQLSAQYQINMAELNKLNQSEKENTAYGQQLVASTEALRVQLQAMAQAEREAAQTAQLQAQASNSKVGSYNQLQAQYKLNILELNNMTEAEKTNTAYGQQLVASTEAIRAQLALKTQSEKEAAQAAQLHAQILGSSAGSYTALNAQLKLNEAELKKMGQAERENTVYGQQLVASTEALRVQINAMNLAAQEEVKIAKLKAQLANAEQGSYNALNAQYQLNIIRLNAMSQAQRETTAAGKALEEQTRAIRARMSEMQEAAGNYTSSVGNYSKVWSGLGFSVQQVVRELPAAAVSLNTFFLAISNNVPIVIDELKRLREQNQLLAAQGKPTISITKQIVKSLISWQTALVMVLTALAMHGKEILKWIDRVLSGRGAVVSITEAMEDMNDELKDNASSYGETMASLSALSKKWKELGNDQKKQTQFLKDNKSEFDKWGVTIDTINQANSVFIENNELFIKALQARAASQAALNLLAKEYGEILTLQAKREIEAKKASGELDYSFSDRVANYAKVLWRQITHPIEMLNVPLSQQFEEQGKRNVEALDKEREEAEESLKARQEVYEKYLTQFDDILKQLGLDSNHKNNKGRQPKDLSNTIDNNGLTIRKKYEESVTALVQDEYAKRRKEADDSVKAENASLRKKQKLNEEYLANVEGKYKKLTDDQVKEIEEQQKLIEKTIANNLRALELEIQKIKAEQAAASLQVQRNNISTTDTSAVDTAVQNKESVITTNVVVTRDASQMEASLVKERELMAEALQLEYELILESNAKMREAGDEEVRAEEDIIAEFNKKKLELFAEYDKQILEARQADVDAQLALVEKGTDRELELLLKRNELARQLALVENAAKPAENQQDTSTINAQYDKSGKQTEADFILERLEQQQALDEAIFNEVERTTKETTIFQLEQELAMWNKKIRLAKEGSLDWSETQIKTAESTVKGIENKLKNLNSIWDALDSYGWGGALLSALGLDDKQISATLNGVDIIMDSISDMYDSLIELAEAEVEAQEERVDAAESALDAEIEARNNGYANSVATAKKELEQEKKKLQEKQQLLDQYEQAQERIDTLTQISSLVTAVAQIWKAFSPLGWVGYAMAGAMTASMFAAFAAAKIKARQAAGATSEYGSGGLEFLEGGSHASGHDIDLGVNNSKGERMHAEGGEALAIINKRRTRKYKKVLPDIIDSLNKGTFEERYGNIFLSGSEAADTAMMQSFAFPHTDLSSIEADLRAIKQQNEIRQYVLPNGTIVIQHKNVKRIIKN